MPVFKIKPFEGDGGGSGTTVLEVENITALTTEQCNTLNPGDVVIKLTADQKHTYTVSYKEDEVGMCLTYVDASTSETVSYDYVEEEWVYNSTDITPLNGGGSGTSGSPYVVCNPDLLEATQNKVFDVDAFIALCESKIENFDNLNIGANITSLEMVFACPDDSGLALIMISQDSDGNVEVALNDGSPLASPSSEHNVKEALLDLKSEIEQVVFTYGQLSVLIGFTLMTAYSQTNTPYYITLEELKAVFKDAEEPQL